MTTPLPLPKYRLNSLLKLRSRLSINPTLLECLGIPVDSEVLGRLCMGMLEDLPSSVDSAALRKSLLGLVGQTLSVRELRHWCWRIVGNMSELIEGRPVMPWLGTRRDEWVPMQIVDGRRWSIRTKRGQSVGTQFKLRALAGSPCPNLFDVFWSRRACSVIASRLGFNLRDVEKPYAYCQAQQLVGCRFYAKFTAQAKSYAPFTEIHPAKDTPAIWKWNRELIGGREPIKRKCPRNFPTNHPCYRCPIGIDKCQWATHAVTYVQKTCTRCQRRQWFDPSRSNEVCLECEYHSLFPEKTDGKVKVSQ